MDTSNTQHARPIHAEMSHLRTEGGELLINGHPLSRRAARVGLTPFYAYDRSLLEDRFFKRPFSPRRHSERGRTGAERSARSA